MSTTFHSLAYFAQNEGTGHFYHYHKSVQKALCASLKEVHVYVPLSAHFADTPEGWKKWFHPFFNKRNRKRFWKDCKRLFTQPSSGKRIFFLEFFGRRDFALYALAVFLFSKKSDEIWILYRDDLEIRRRKDLKVIRFWSKVLQWRCQNRLRPLTDSALLAQYYTSWFKKRLPVVPILTTDYHPIQPCTRDRLICSWLGNPRPDKGASEIAHLVEIDDPAAKNIELDVSGATFFPPVKNEIEIHLRKVSLTEEEYRAALMRCDVVLLPYDPKLYRRRTSGVFVEAILAGKIPVVKEGSWLSHELKRFDLHALIVDWDDAHFFTHLFTLVKDRKMLAKLQKMQEAYRRFHGQENFQASLEALLQS